MERYRLDVNTKENIEDSVVPIGVYQVVDGHVVTLAVSNGLIENKVSLRIGVFSNAQQKADVEERFSCAKIAADMVKNDPKEICGFYVDT